MSERVLITGGAGFIGSHAADEFLRAGYSVRALDALDPQVHGGAAAPPAYLDPEVELVVGDVRDAATVRRALEGCDRVVHLAAAVGVGQSMYEIARYTDVNNLGTAVLMEALMETPPASLVVASSMSVYGEGMYRDADGRSVPGEERSRAALERGEWEPTDAQGRPLEPIPTPETKAPALASIYALGKYDQERMALMIGSAYGFPATALRFFNVFGARQALSNPYTGVLAIFGSRVLNGKPPMVYEDGEQRRDFVAVEDVARAIRLAAESPAAAGRAVNVGSGRSHSVAEVARLVAGAMGRPDLRPELTGKARIGDIRHCFADVTLARDLLVYEPRRPLEDGIGDLAEWIAEQTADDRVEAASAELHRRGLTVERARAEAVV